MCEKQGNYISGYELLPTKMLGYFLACLLGLKGCIFFSSGESN